MNKISNKYRDLFKKTVEIMRKPVMSVLPGHLSFFLLLSSIPIILIFGVIASAFSLSFDSIAEFITLSLPASTSKLIIPLFSGKALDISVVLLVLSALYLASRATKAIIMAANNIYEVSSNPMQEIIRSIIITVLLILLFIFIIIILILGGKILEIIDKIPEISFISKNILKSIDLIRWPIALFVIFFTIKLIYTMTPNKKISSKSVNKGATFTTIAWILITFIYSFYVTHYASYNDYYGSASNLVVLMLWVYLISQIFVIGMIINSIEEKEEEKKIKKY
ncbi:MAG: YihY/virulence factor BrkB family protein [Bacilli bacterium]|nr:YihY/virulence factor BrkB family protein [Bacilli bacterium]